MTTAFCICPSCDNARFVAGHFAATLDDMDLYLPDLQMPTDDGWGDVPIFMDLKMPKTCFD